MSCRLCSSYPCRCPSGAARRGPTGPTGPSGTVGDTQTGMLTFSGTVTSGTDPGGVVYSLGDRGVGTPAAAAGNIYAMPRAGRVHTLALRSRQAVPANVTLTATLLRNGINVLSASMNDVGAGTIVRDPAGPLALNGTTDTYECQVIITRNDSGTAVVLDVTVTIGLLPP